MLKNPFVFGILLFFIVVSQIAASYLSAASFLEDDIILGLSFFLFVPILGFILAFYVIWFRKNRPACGSRYSEK